MSAAQGQHAVFDSASWNLTTRLGLSTGFLKATSANGKGSISKILPGGVSVVCSLPRGRHQPVRDPTSVNENRRLATSIAAHT